MREINLNSGVPLTFTIAADARVSETNYVDDQIWELSINGGEPQAVALHTTYGLRAAKMRLFPRYTLAHESVIEPSKFHKPPIVVCFYPNYLKLNYAPFEELNIECDYWVPSSNAVSGRVKLTNTSAQSIQVSFEWIASLNPSEDGSRITSDEIDSVPVLVGATGNIAPVVFITGGAVTVNSPYTALKHDLDLPPGKPRVFTWSQAALSSPRESFTYARQISGLNWEAEIARLELLNSNQIEIYTGDEDWDIAFALSQNKAFSLFLGDTPHLPKPSFTGTRLPDDGYSYRQDGSDFSPLWSGQTPLDVYYLANLCITSSPNLIAGLLDNFFDSINENGEIDWRPGLGGQFSNRLATPILAILVWQVYEILEDVEFLSLIFPKLLKFFFSWFSPVHDRDEDGIPEWDHPLQAGFEDHPLFARWHKWAAGIDITSVESPALAAFLYQECQTIIRIARLLKKEESISALESISEKLWDGVESSWNEDVSSYTYWDRDSHIRSRKIMIAEQAGSGIIQLNRNFSEPVRLVLRIKTSQETTRNTQITIHGSSLSGKHRVENISSEKLIWFPGWGTATSELVYSSLEFVDIQGLEDDDTVLITSSDLSHQDITTLLPLWAGIPSTERADTLVKKSITNQSLYWAEYGLPACPDMKISIENDICRSVFLPWCLLIGEGLISYGYREEAAELVTRIMNGILGSINTEGGFRQFYDADNGTGLGDVNSLWGLAPIGLFLNALGVRLISPRKVFLAGKNPFPWPVTVKYRGMTVLRGINRTQVIFTDGQTLSIDDQEPSLVELE